MLEKHEIKGNFSFTPLEWETVFAKMVNALDDIPIAKGNSSNVSDIGFEILSPNRLKMGRNNYRSLHIDGRLVDTSIPSSLLDKNRKIMSIFFQTLIDRLHFLNLKPKKWTQTDDRTPILCDIVMFVFNESNAGTDWKLGKVIEVQDRKVRIMYSAKSEIKAIPSKKFVWRSFRQVSILFSESDTFVNSSKYFSEAQHN
jgi:hypothetical protein